MILKPFKCRCSGIGSIMTNPRSKSDKGLSATCIAFLEDWAKQQLYGRRKEFKSKYTDKGNYKEDNAIVFAKQVYNWAADTVKNEEYFEDDFFTGTPDIILTESVEDIKNAWDAFTFPLFETEIPSKMKGYDWQGRGYMQLTGRKKFGLVYCLMDAPENLIEKAAYYKQKDLGLEELPVELYEEVKAFMSYEDLAPVLRTNRFEITADPIKVAAMQTRVLECRAYIAKNIQPKFVNLQNKLA